MAAADDDANNDPLKWIRRGVYLAALLIGWLFILWQNKFYVSPPAVFVCLAHLAVVSTVYALWRTGVVAVADEEPGGDSTWGRSLGALGELEREKKTLLKAIKEAEFDREMGKLSKADAEEMIGIYRARAIEVIRELDNLETGAAGTVREQIEREVRARLEIEAKTKKAAEEEAATARAGKKKPKKDAKTAAADAAAAAAKAAQAAEEARVAAAEASAAAADEQASTDELTDSSTTDAATAAASDDSAPKAKEATS
ncbi:MAG: hypothetical protein H0T42_31070 [Deltaproteobacteria bacterium]|nr:hypothetical protein [Deltaproteobacteria bacterium]